MAITISGDTPNFSAATITTGTVTTLTAPTSTITTLNAPSGVLATQNGMTGIAKAWVNFSGSTPTINGQFNVSSITRNGTGDYTVNFTTAMANTAYSIVGTAGALGPGNNPYVVMENSSTARTTSACRIYVFWITNGQVDPSTVNIAVLGA